MSTTTFAQTASLNQMCRQVNPKTNPGPIAYYAPGGTPMRTFNGRDDGPAAGVPIYLTSSPPELSADGKYVRVWFDSRERNFRQGWLEMKLRDGDDMLKMGNSSWRTTQCAK
ncbi:MAG: hypothetical protein AAF572_23305 [Cyanobacteria bacterium P01_B01_bin.77]